MALNRLPVPILRENAKRKFVFLHAPSIPPHPLYKDGKVVPLTVFGFGRHLDRQGKDTFQDGRGAALSKIDGAQ